MQRPSFRHTALQRVAFGLLAAAAAACSGVSSTIGSSDGGPDTGNPAGCPSSLPAPGTPCGSAGLQCTYGCNSTATCSGRAWSVVQTAISCPADGGVGADGAITCSSSNDCKATLTCSPGGAPSGCGICAAPQNPCKTDLDCKLVHDAAPPMPMICGPLGPCTCPQGGATGDCIPACQGPNDCGAGETCDPTGRCISKPCTSDADCPSTTSLDYACGTTGVCAPKTCNTNADCGLHFCVNGTCYPQQGICVSPAA